MTKIRRYASAIMVVGVFAGCTGGVTGSPAPEKVSPALSAALSRVRPAALGETGDFEFGDTARLRELAATEPKVWRQETFAGSGSLAAYGQVIKDGLGIDLTTATSALTAGSAPAALVLITGGQHADAIKGAATKAGWSGSGTLTRPRDLSTMNSVGAGLAIFAPQIRPLGSDVVVGGLTADMSLLAESGAGADGGPLMTSATNCLGDVVLAQGTGFGTRTDPSASAVGVRASSGRITSVICLEAGGSDQATELAGRVRTELASGTSARSGRPWKELLPNAVVDPVAGTPAMVRITSDTASTNPHLVLSLLVQRDLPDGE